MEWPVPTISIPPPLLSNNNMETVSSSRSPQLYQTTTNTNFHDAGGIQARTVQHPNTIYNLTNSSDIVIGPVTQFNDRVTIYQYTDATLRTSEAKPRSHNPSSFASCLRRNWLNILASCATLLGLSTTVYFIFYTNHSEVSRPPIEFGNSYDSDTFPNLAGHYVIDREKWGALNHTKLLNMMKLKYPLKNVVVSHMGVQAEPCSNIYTCSIKMRALQDNSIGNKGLLDVSANFYLGGDGNIYTGRGWNYENSYGDKCLAVTFLGDFMRYDLEEKQYDAFKHLLNYGRAHNLLSLDYKLFGLNQTHLSKYSPGVNVVKRIKNLSRYSNCGEEGFEPCGKDTDIQWNFKKNPK